MPLSDYPLGERLYGLLMTPVPPPPSVPDYSVPSLGELLRRLPTLPGPPPKPDWWPSREEPYSDIERRFLLWLNPPKKYPQSDWGVRG